MPFELFFWVSGITFLACINPESSSLPTFCVLKMLGVAYCPGCGLGSSISYLLRGEFGRSLGSHPLGVFALIVIVHRITVLLRSMLSSTHHQSKKGYNHA